jgi:hypothetical protein
VWFKADLLRAVYPWRWSQRLPGERPDVSPIDGTIATLRKQGHRITVWQGFVTLKEAS